MVLKHFFCKNAQHTSILIEQRLLCGQKSKSAHFLQKKPFSAPCPLRPSGTDFLVLPSPARSVLAAQWRPPLCGSAREGSKKFVMALHMAFHIRFFKRTSFSIHSPPPVLRPRVAWTIICGPCRASPKMTPNGPKPPQMGSRYG